MLVLVLVLSGVNAPNSSSFIGNNGKTTDRIIKIILMTMRYSSMDPRLDYPDVTNVCAYN